MEIKRTQLVVRGMQQDLSISKFNPEFSYENRNIRITAREDSSLLSVTNERGNKKFTKFSSKAVDRRDDVILTASYFKNNSNFSELHISASKPTASLIRINVTLLRSDGQEVFTGIWFEEGQTNSGIEFSGNPGATITKLSIGDQYKSDEKYFYYLKDTVNSSNNDVIPESHPYIEGTFNGNFKGTCIGYASLNKYIILFTHDSNNVDRIYRVKDLSEVMLMFEGDLNFSLEHLIDTMPIYESESTQKVYWTDGYNQPRVINFIKDPEPKKWGNTSYYDFSPSIEPYNFIEVSKNDTGGEFAPGVIQYAFTYITDWQGVETNIANTSGLNYISYPTRGAKKDETCYNSFSIKLFGLDQRYKYIRVYSIHRTSLNATPTVKIIGEYNILPTTGTYIPYPELKNDLLTKVRTIPEYANATYEDSYPKLSSSFSILADNIDNWYHINIRSVNNGTITLQDILEHLWKNSSYYVDVVDTGVVGTNTDSTELLYKNNPEAIISTMASKDSALFVGGYTIPRDSNGFDSINLYQEFLSGTNKISLELGRSSSLSKITCRFIAQYNVASDITIRVNYSDNTTDSYSIPEGNKQSASRTIASTVTIISYEISKSTGLKYYTDSKYTYYLDNENPPESLLIEGSVGSYRWDYRDPIEIEEASEVGTYTYTPYTLSKGSYCKHFKRGQPYRFAIQGQLENGRWGDPIVIKNLEDGYLVLQDTEDNNLIYELDNVCTKSFVLDPVRNEDNSIYNSIKPDVQKYRFPSIDNPSEWRSTSNINYSPNKNAFVYMPSLLGKPEDNKNNFKPYTQVPNLAKYIYNDKEVQELSQSYYYYKEWDKISGKISQSMWRSDLRRPSARGVFFGNSQDFDPTEDLSLLEDNSTFTDLTDQEYQTNYTNLFLNKLVVKLSNTICKDLYNRGYRRVRLLYVEPTKVNRKYPAQGILTNTVFIPNLRATNSCWSYTDYLSRPREVYRVWNEKSKFFKNWGKKSGQRWIGDSSGITAEKTSSGDTIAHWLASPYFYPMIHNFTLQDGAENNEWLENAFLLWNIRPNYGHLMGTIYEQPRSNNNTKEYVWGNKGGIGNFLNDTEDNGGTDNDNDMNYYPDVQIYTPRVIPEANFNNILFDDSILDFWSPDVEYQEVDKNYFENTVEGFQIRGLSLVTSTTNSNYIIKDNSNVIGLIGYSDVSNYSPVHTVKSLKGKGLSNLYYDESEIVDIGSGVHRLIIGTPGVWAPGNFLNDNISWASLNASGKPDSSPAKLFKDKIFSFKKYCLDTTIFKDLSSLYYDINKPSLFINGDSIRSISLYKTAYSGEEVTYNPGMDELLLQLGTETTINSNIPIKYSANTHLTFSLPPKKELFVSFNGVAASTKVVDPKTKILPTLPEFSAYAKFHNNNKIIGNHTRELSLLNINWWPSKNSDRPDIYKNEAYSVTDSRKRGEWDEPWKVSLQVNRPLTADITVWFKYRLGFWKAKKTSKTGTGTITLKKGDSSAIVKFAESWFNMRDWSTIEVLDYNISNVGGDYIRSTDKMCATSPDQLVVLVNKSVYINAEKRIASDPFYIGSYGQYATEMIDPLVGEILDPVYDNVAIQNLIFQRNLPYFTLVDLVRSDAFIYADWTDNNLYQQVWTPCGKPAILPEPDDNDICIVEATEGDVFVGRYDCLRVASPLEDPQRFNDIISFVCESYTNTDGRSDVNRYLTDTRAMNFENFGLLNEVYSQSDNYFTFNKDDERTLESTGKFPNQFSWTLTKNPNSLVDNWTNLTFASTYNLEGEYGKLTKLVMHNNQLYAFQDKAISNILYNTRVQVPVSDGLPIELANSSKVNGVRYISTTSGAQNKWAITTTRSGIYYIDHAKKNLNLISAEGIKEITSSAGFAKWALNNLGYSTGELNLQEGMSNWKISRDSIHDDVYVHDKNECLVFSERLAAFTSFFDYKNIPFMFRQDGKFLSIFSENDSTELYEQNAGNYNQFYGKSKVTSYIDYIVNPEMSRDKVFNNIEFRADAFRLENGEYTKYNPNRTLDHIHVRNEFQDTGDVALLQYKNLQKKFRMWRAYIPRDTKEIENYKLNRIRNPWIKMKLSYTPTEEEDNKLVLHDLIVNYTV